jgi:hypothetical protein
VPHHHHKHAFVPQTAPAQTSNSTPTVDGEQPRDDRPMTAEAIRLCAYCKWESAGKPSGDGVEFWLEAEHELGTAQ